MKMNSEKLLLGGFIWNVGARQLVRVEPSAQSDKANSVSLTPKQYQLLKCLYQAHPETLNKEQIIEKVWGTKHTSPESLPQLIIRTRTAIEDLNKTVLINDPGVGYSLKFRVAESEPEEHVAAPEPTSVAPPKLTENAKTPVNKWQAALLFMALVTAYNSYNALSALYYAWDFKRVHHVNPYPHLEQNQDGTISLNIDSHECKYTKKELLLQCE